MLSYQDSRRNLICSNPTWKSWISVAPEVWLALLIGWIWVVVSLALGFQVPSSGAVLVCSAVLGELFFERLIFRRWPRKERGKLPSNFRLIEDSEGRLGLAGGGMLICGKVDGFGGSVKALLGLSRDDDWNDHGYVNEQYIKGTFWLYTKTLERVERKLSISIIISAVIGTVIWGYSHCLYTSCSGPI